MTKLGWLVRLAAAVVAGVAWRFLRRLAGRPPRIWHGHQPVHLTRDLVLAEREAGFASRSVVTVARVLKYALITSADFDVELGGPGIADNTLHWRAMIDLHLHADIWSAYFDCHFFPVQQRKRNELAIGLARAAGIRIVVMPHGSDVVHLAGPPTRYDWTGRMQRDYPNWDFREQTFVSRERIALFDRFASLVVAADPATARLLSRVDCTFKYFPVSIPADASYPDPTVAVPRIVHAPNHRLVKGTDFLFSAVKRVQAAGFACELVMVEGVPHAEALEMYRRADLIADQFCVGAFGAFALETLAMGKPVLVYLDEEHLANPAFNLPMLNATAENLAEVLAVLIAVPQLRTRLGKAGRAAVERYQSSDAIGEAWTRIHRHIWWGDLLALESTRHFDPARGKRSPIEDPASIEFWPVPVDDLANQINEALARIRRA